MNPDDKKSYSSIETHTCLLEYIHVYWKKFFQSNQQILLSSLTKCTSHMLSIISDLPFRVGDVRKFGTAFLNTIQTRSSELRRNWGSAEPEKRIDNLEKYILGSQRNILISDENLYLARCTTPEGGVTRRVIKWGGKIIAGARDDDRRRQNNFGVPSVSFHFHGNDVGSIRRDSEGSTDGWAPYTHEFPEPQSIRSRDCSSDCFGLNGSGRKEGRKRIKNARRSWGIYADGVKEKENVLHLSSSRK